MPDLALTQFLYLRLSGSPQEEASLVEHVGKLVPGAAALTEAGQLCELLVLLGHFEDARVLQRELAKWLSEHKVGSLSRDTKKMDMFFSDRHITCHTAIVEFFMIKDVILRFH